MATGLEIPSCSACGSYVHPFLGACPVCGVARRSRYEDALADPDLGFRTLPSDPDVTEQVRQVVLRYTMKRHREPEESLLRPGLTIVADTVAYRVTVAGPRAASSERGHLGVTDEAVVIREKSPIREIHRVPLDAILAIGHTTGGQRRADAWAGLAFDDRLEQGSPPSVDGDLVVTYAGDQGLERLALANRRGIFAARARDDHFEIIARWLGMLAGAAAEERWMAVGPRRYAVQLGLVAGVADDGARASAAELAPAARGGGAEPAPAGRVGAEPVVTATTSVRGALEELEELRAARLVTDDEYAAKRREILARL
jgi:hypothetical protein